MNDEIIGMAAINGYLNRNRFHDDPYDRQRRQEMTLEFGTATGPVTTATVKRGENHPEWDRGFNLVEQINLTKEVWSRPKDNTYFHKDDDEETKERMRKYNEHLQEFFKTPNEELYFVFADDCVALDEPVLKGQWNQIGDEWNVLANWRDTPEFQAVWNRRKLTYAQTVERIKNSQPIPEPPPFVFTIDLQYKEQIDKILSRLVSIDDNSPHKLWEEQKKYQNELKQLYALHAAEKLMILIVTQLGHQRPPAVSPVGSAQKYTLSFSQCQYDHWNVWYDFMVKNCAVDKNWNGNEQKFPIAKWDLSQDPDFAQSEQKVFPIKIEYYDSHACGW